MDFAKYLRQREIPEDTYCIEQKIDAETFPLMSEEEKKKLILKQGDRVAIQSFCEMKTKNTTKLSHIERLKAKIGGKENQNQRKAATQQKNALKKKTRFITIGWLCSNTQGVYRHVRSTFGEGTRRKSVPRSTTCAEVLEIAKTLFFPNGVSSKGQLEEYNYELLDYSRKKIDNLNLTIDELYNVSGLNDLRFYLATNGKRHLPKNHKSQSDSDDEYIPSSMAAREPFHDYSLRTSHVNNDSQDEYISNVVTAGTHYADNSLHSAQTNTNNYSDEELIQFTVVGSQLASDSVIQFPQFNSESALNTYLYSDIDDLNTSNNQSIVEEITLLKLHRGHIFHELLLAFEQDINIEKIKIEMILPNGKTEHAEDFGGVLRDAVSEFWENFYEKCTIGTELKVPYLRHDFGENQWKAVARILIKGYKLVGYFPIRICPAFLKTCFGIKLETTEIYDNFLKVISQCEAAMLNDAIKDFSSVDNDELLDFMTAYDAKWLPKEDNIQLLIEDIARKKIVQKPAYVSRCFSTIFTLNPLDEKQLNSIYEKLQPTIRNCLNMFIIKVDENGLASNEVAVFGFLKKNIRESELRTRQALLRYCTGSDLPIVKIYVEFSNLEGIQRVPVAHTCTGLLELPTSYESFVIFRCEMNELLSSNIWAELASMGTQGITVFFEDRNMQIGHSEFHFLRFYSNEKISGISNIRKALNTYLYSDIDDLNTSNNQSIVEEITLLKLHRGHIFHELLLAFEQDINIEKIKIEMILPNGKTEHAEDFGGVLRDAVSEFWENFYEKCTIGTELKVPYLRHDFGENQWKAVARILIKGYKLVGYFPIRICPAFLKTCFGIKLETTEIYDNFLKVISQCEAAMLNDAIKDFSSVDNDELLDFMTAYDAKWLPKEDNIQLLIEDIARKKIVQKPAYVSRCFSTIFTLNPLDEKQLNSIYEKLQPTIRNCLNMFSIKVDENGLASNEVAVFGFLKKNIRESELRTRQALLRYCTGSDLPIVKIYVEFSNLEGIQRVPVPILALVS